VAHRWTIGNGEWAMSIRYGTRSGDANKPGAITSGQWTLDFIRDGALPGTLLGRSSDEPTYKVRKIHWQPVIVAWKGGAKDGEGDRRQESAVPESRRPYGAIPI